ncbi:hypothetical protein ACFY2K_26110 [Kitasatospora sp. NPDC001309]|uniref:hypothetical protein n=1 Tax=Kitasatospora sp. NPDC001309 TaxID=3364013 RepID=UPI0036B9F490
MRTTTGFDDNTTTRYPDGLRPLMVDTVRGIEWGQIGPSPLRVYVILTGDHDFYAGQEVVKELDGYFGEPVAMDVLSGDRLYYEWTYERMEVGASSGKDIEASPS